LNRRSTVLIVALLCVLSPESRASSRDDGFAKAMAVYAQRAEVTKHVEAVSVFSELAKAHPADREVQLWCARTASYAAHRIFDTKVKQKIAGRGVKCAQRMLKADPTDYDGRLWWILCRLRYASGGNPIDALKAAPKFKVFIAKMIKKAPKRAPAYMMLGVLMRELPGKPLSFGDPGRALKLLKRADKLAPNEPEILLELANAYRKTERLDDARATYRRCIDKGVTREGLEWESADARRYAAKMLAEMN
jgi:tetratricopeptide (TPR) repeat protein